MRLSCALVLALAAVVVPPPAAAQSPTRIRTLDVSAGAALEEGLERSSRFRSLVAAIEGSDLIVHVVTSIELPGGAVGATRLAWATTDTRYVRIAISADLPREQRIAILAHELQHACEIAGSDVRDEESMRLLFRSIGRLVDSATGDLYDTPAAIAAGDQVWAELQSPLHMR